MAVENWEKDVAAADARFSKELERLREEFMRAGNLKAAVAAEKLAETVRNPRVVGKWTFWIEKSPRFFEFRDDGTFSGQYSNSKAGYTGTWKWNGDRVDLYHGNEKEASYATVTIDGRTARFRSSGSTMNGERGR